MISFLGSLLTILRIAVVIAVICAACLVVDTVLNVKYYLWERENRKSATGLEGVTQYDHNFFDDGK